MVFLYAISGPISTRLDSQRLTSRRRSMSFQGGLSFDHFANPPSSRDQLSTHLMASPGIGPESFIESRAITVRCAARLADAIRYKPSYVSRISELGYESGKTIGKQASYEKQTDENGQKEFSKSTDRHKEHARMKRRPPLRQKPPPTTRPPRCSPRQRP